MREYFILTATFTAPFILLALLDCTPAIFRALRSVKSVPSVKSVFSTPTLSERR